ncbi:MAG: alpha/beta hydrolase [Lachnospiraceae bacterium]|nr:alpha/beta hydrolase [Lachnospiraceae bacterium]
MNTVFMADMSNHRILYFMPGYSIGEMIYNIIIVYLMCTFLLTVYSIIRMYVLQRKCTGIKYGKARLDELQSSGRLRQLPIYTLDEITDNKDLAVVRLTAFMTDSKEKRRYAIVLPGGGYAHCMAVQEGYPVAAKLNEMGYTAFVLEYRTRFHCSAYAPMEDLSRAVKYIESHADDYNVIPGDYALIGFSAGGNLAGVYGSHYHGYEEYGTAKPGALIMGYPWSNMTHWKDHPYWNIWKALIGAWLSERGLIYMFGPFASKEKMDSLSVQNLVEEDYVPTYIFNGGSDVLVPASHHAEVLVDALEENGINHSYRKYFGLPHGIGLAVGTKAENWIYEAIKFWEENVEE